jgi:hypothetical protein
MRGARVVVGSLLSPTNQRKRRCNRASLLVFQGLLRVAGVRNVSLVR